MILYLDGNLILQWYPLIKNPEVRFGIQPDSGWKEPAEMNESYHPQMYRCKLVTII